MDYIVKISCDGTVQKIDVTDEENDVTDYKIFTTIHELLGNFIGIRYTKLSRPFVMLVDYEEQLNGTHYNKIASKIHDAIIVGDALIMAEGFRDMDEPDLYYLTDSEADWVIKYLKTMG